MKIIYRVLLLLILEACLVYIDGNKQELNLNFYQDDYQIKFERLEAASYNKDLIDLSIVTFKYNRTTTVANGTFTVKFNGGDDLVATIQAYTFLSNEYRLFPLRFSASAGKAFAANIAGMGDCAKCGNFTGLPLIKGRKYHICNWQPDPSKFPPFIPNGQYKLEIELSRSVTQLGVGNAYGTVFRPIRIP